MNLDGVQHIGPLEPSGHFRAGATDYNYDCDCVYLVEKYNHKSY